MKKTETYDEQEARVLRRPGRPDAFSECTVDPETRQVSFHVTPPCPVDY